MSTNTVTFRYVTGTNKARAAGGRSAGAEFHARSGPDTLIGGNGDDRLYADKGDDLILASAGNDLIDGGLGTLDRLQYDGDRDELPDHQSLNGGYIIHKPDGSYDRVGGVETLVFNDGSGVRRQPHQSGHHLFRHR